MTIMHKERERERRKKPIMLDLILEEDDCK
jgi:hypothetical protein